MLTVYDALEGALIRREGPAPITPAAVWIDLLNPTKDEDVLVEQALTISVPTREEMSEIEASSRLYHEGSGYYMTAVVLHQPEDARGERRIRRNQLDDFRRRRFVIARHLQHTNRDRRQRDEGSRHVHPQRSQRARSRVRSDGRQADNRQSDTAQLLQSCRTRGP